MDNHIEQERVEARKVLEAANLPYVIDGQTGDLLNVHLETVADFFYHEEDIHLCANAPTWLRNSLDREEQLIAENEKKESTIKTLCLTIGEFDSLRQKLESKVAEQDKEIQSLKRLVEYP